MNATAYLTPDTILPRARKTKTRVGFSEKCIALQVDITADRRRIFDALTLPEYIETWLSLPCAHTGCHTIASQADSSYRLDHYAAGGLDLSISGSYRVCRRGKMFFSWRKSRAFDGSESLPESAVQIRLYGDFARSTLCLSHTGYFSKGEYRWHTELWNRSLRNLQQLFPSSS
jgi:uncharacterized protein YndB with AHSA1/START domain